MNILSKLYAYSDYINFWLGMALTGIVLFAIVGDAIINKIKRSRK
jgi:hypothetical protein